MIEYRKIVAGVIFCVAGGHVAVAAADTLTYKNDRFGFEIVLPYLVEIGDDSPPRLDWQITGYPTATDGTSFQADRGRIKLLTFGGMFWQDSWQDVYRSAAQNIEDDGGAITYRRVTDNWFVYSGKTAAGDLFYQRTERAMSCLHDDITITAKLTYSPGEHWVETVIEPIMGTLKGC